jgi:hypothetical protein
MIAARLMQEDTGERFRQSAKIPQTRYVGEIFA